MIVKKKTYSVYNYAEISHISEVKQGDIFQLIPYYSPDFLMEAPSTNRKIVINENNKILNSIVKTGHPSLVETLIFPTWAILASQNCDIRDGFDLLFFPLVHYNLPEKGDFIEFVEKKIRSNTRKMFLPEINTKDITKGPFSILFQSPFYVPYDIINSNLKKCWSVHLKLSACKVFTGKIRNFFTRTPIDELFFLNKSDLEEYFNLKCEKCWNDKNDASHYIKSAEKIILKIKEYYFGLKNEGDAVKIKGLNLLDNNLINKIKILVDKNWILKEELPINKKITLFLQNKVADYFKEFNEIIYQTILSSNNIFNNYRNLLKKIGNLDDTLEFKNFQKEKFKKEYRKIPKKNAILKIENIIQNEDQFISYCEPYKSLEEFHSKFLK